MFVVLATGCSTPADPHAIADPVDQEVIRWEEFDSERLAHAIFHESNRVRRSFELRPFRVLPRLEQAADLQAGTMAMLGQLSHDNPFRGRANVYERIRATGIEPQQAGENVALTPVRVAPPGYSGSGEWPWPTYAELATRIVEQWLNSPPHRLALLNRDFTHLACATWPARGAMGGELVYSVQVFVVPRRNR